MPARSHVVTFPGKVRIVEPGPKDEKTGKRPAVAVRTAKNPRFTHARTNGRFKNETVTHVHVPSGYRLDYELVHSKRRGLSGKPEKPLAMVKIVPDGEAAPVTHAELAHEFEETTAPIQMGYLERTKEEIAARSPRQPNMVDATTRTLVRVKATSLEDKSVVGEGKDAAEAVKDMRDKLAKKAPKAEDAEDVSKGVASNVEVRDGAPEPLPIPAPHLGTAVIPGDEGTGEGSGFADKPVKREG